MKNISEMMGFAFDPVYNRPLRETPHAIAGLEMTRYMFETCTSAEQCAKVVVKNKANAMRNPYAAFGAEISENDVLNSDPVSLPLHRLDIAPHADGAVVAVIADGETALALTETPIWIEGLGWCTDTPTLEMRDWGEAAYARIAAEMAYKMAGIANPAGMIDFAEICDEYSYKELQHMEALKLCEAGRGGAPPRERRDELRGGHPHQRFRRRARRRSPLRGVRRRTRSSSSSSSSAARRARGRYPT